MRPLISAALALLLGVVLGGLGPKEDLRAAEGRIAELEAQECERPVAEGFAALLAAGAASRATPDPDSVAPEPEARARAPQPPRGDPATDAPRDDTRSEPARAPLDSARAAMELRRVQARAAMLEQASPDDAQLSEIDDALADMNDELFTLADEVSARLLAGETPERREMMIFAAEALDIVLVADERVQASLTQEQLSELDEAAVDPLSYVDPAILELFGGINAP